MRKTAKCKFCCRTLTSAYIPNRGYVMAHQQGQSAVCQQLQATGRDAVSNQIRIDAAKAAKAARGSPS
jgi:hypothetical protein